MRRATPPTSAAPASAERERAARRVEILFVGERRSATAQRRGWTWRDGRLAALPLFEALGACGIDPARSCDFINLWTDDDLATIPPKRVSVIRGQAGHGVAIVALGRRVAAELARLGIAHIAMVHPAARGKIRRRDRYIAHVQSCLAGLGDRARAHPVGARATPQARGDRASLGDAADRRDPRDSAVGQTALGLQ